LATRFVSAFAGDAAADAKRAMTPATAARRLTPLREGGREGGVRDGRTRGGLGGGVEGGEASRASRAGIKSEGPWAERIAGKSP